MYQLIRNLLSQNWEDCKIVVVVMIFEVYMYLKMKKMSGTPRNCFSHGLKNTTTTTILQFFYLLLIKLLPDIRKKVIICLRDVKS